MSLILTNAKVYTADNKKPWAKTVVIENEKIVYVGNDTKEEFQNCGDCDAQIYDMHGKMIIPGIIDSHIHPGMIAQCSWHVKMPLSYDLEEILTFIKDYAERHPKEEKPFLYFEYYPSVLFDKDGPKKELLDTVVDDRPCLVQDFGEHMAWVNSKMLEALEVDKNTLEKEKISGLACFVRNEKGEPTGFVKEMAWKSFEEKMYKNINWRPPVEITEKLMEPVLDFLISHGVTAIADGFIEGESELETLATIEGKGQLYTYYDGFVRCDKLNDLPEKLSEAKRFQEKYSSKHIKINTMKIFMDGTNESGNSLLVEPMENHPSSSYCGEAGISEEDFTEYLLYCNDEGFDVHVHVVGDGGFRRCCNALEKAKKKIGKKWKIQLTLAHCELVHPDDMLRPAELGININWTPRWAGGCYGEQAKIYMGEKRWNTMYQFNPMIENDILVSFSSDVITWSKLERANPFFGMQIGHTRVDIADPLDAERFPGSVRPPENAVLSREDLLKGSTINGAKQMHWDVLMGSIQVGKIANMVILSDNFFEVDPFKIININCDAVIFEGKIVKGSI